MSYRVEYDTEGKWERGSDAWGLRRFVTTAVFLLLFFLMVMVFWSDGKEILFQIFVPGDSITTWNEFQQLRDQLHQGIPFPFAFREFCHEILHGYY